MKWRSRARTDGREGRCPQRRAEHCARRRAKRSAAATCSSAVKRADARHRMPHCRPQITNSRRKSSRLHPSIGSTSIGLRAQPGCLCQQPVQRVKRSHVTSARSMINRAPSRRGRPRTARAHARRAAQKRSRRRQRCCGTCRLETPSAVFRRRPVGSTQQRHLHVLAQRRGDTI